MKNWISNVNLDPAHNVGLAFDIGINVPEYKFMSEVSEEDRLEMMASGEWEFLTSIALKKQEGVDIMLNFLWDGEQFKMPLIVFRDRMLLTGSQSIRLQENLVTLFSADKVNRIINYELEKLGNIIKVKAPEYKGFVGIDVTLNVDQIYYHRIFFGASMDVVSSIALLHGLEPEEMVDSFKEGKKLNKVRDYISSLRLYDYPYNPLTNIAITDKAIEIGVLEHQNLYRGSDSVSVCFSGQTVSQSWKNLYRKMEGISKFGICYRTDGGDVMRKKYSKLKEWSYL